MSGTPYPSSLATRHSVCTVDLYFIRPAMGWGPCMRLLATSHGMLTTEAMVPAQKPIRSRTGTLAASYNSTQ